MTEEPKDTPPIPMDIGTEMLAACRAGHGYVCQALRVLQAPYEYDADSEIEHALRWLGQTELALSRYIQANTPDCPPPPRETEPNPNPEPEGQVPAEPEGPVPPKPDVQPCA